MTSISIAAVGDVDGDGFPDLIVLYDLQGMIVDEKGSYITLTWTTVITKINLVDALAEGTAVTIDPFFSGIMHDGSSETNLRNVTFDSMEKQLWTEYMGKQGNSIYP